MDYALQRRNMVESQLRPSDVTDRRILRAMGNLPREAFVPAEQRAVAYRDDPVPLDDARPPRLGSSPRVLAKLLVLAAVEPTDRVLVVGAGRGYAAAVLAEMGVAAVVALESNPGLATAARATLAAWPQVTVVEGALAAGVPDRAPFDVIVIDGAVAVRPDAVLAQLAPGGRAVGVLLEGGVGRGTLWRRVGDHVGATDTFDAATAVLPGFERQPTFMF